MSSKLCELIHVSFSELEWWLRLDLGGGVFEDQKKISGKEGEIRERTKSHLSLADLSHLIDMRRMLNTYHLAAHPQPQDKARFSLVQWAPIMELRYAGGFRKTR